MIVMFCVQPCSRPTSRQRSSGRNFRPMVCGCGTNKVQSSELLPLRDHGRHSFLSHRAVGRSTKISGGQGGSTKASKLRTDLAKAPTTHSGMGAVTFISDEEAQRQGSDHLSRTNCSSSRTTSAAIIATKDVRIVKVDLIFRQCLYLFVYIDTA